MDRGLDGLVIVPRRLVGGVSPLSFIVVSSSSVLLVEEEEGGAGGTGGRGHNPPKRRKSDDLPHPLGPRMRRFWCGWMENVREGRRMVPEGESSGTELKEMAFLGRVLLGGGWVVEEDEEEAIGDVGVFVERAEGGGLMGLVAAAAAAADRGSTFAEGVFENLPC